jgi:hypothetical protein
MKLLAAASQYAALYQALFDAAPAESAAFLTVEPDGDLLRLRSFKIFDPTEIDGSAYGHISISEDVHVRELASIKRARAAVVEVHTHPGSHDGVGFSHYDDEELPRFARYVQNKLAGQPFGALVLGESGYAGRAWTADRQQAPLELELVGEQSMIPDWAQPNESSAAPSSRYDRQVRALGTTAQHRIAELRVAVVGLGGTGSQVVQQLVHLGVRDFLLIEDDRVEETNLPRLAGARWWDSRLSRSKVYVARRMIRGLAPRATIDAPGSLRSSASLDALCSADVILGCVDNDGARLILAEFAAAYLIPYLDLGVGIEEIRDASSAAIGGRVAFYVPGGACICCADELDLEEAAEDLETEALHEIRVQRGYARDRAVEPSLMPLNTATVGLGMMELLAYIAGYRPVRPFFRYDALTGATVPSRVVVNLDCPVCQPAFARGPRQHVERYAIGA